MKYAMSMWKAEPKRLPPSTTEARKYNHLFPTRAGSESYLFQDGGHVFCVEAAVVGHILMAAMVNVHLAR